MSRKLTSFTTLCLFVIALSTSGCSPGGGRVTPVLARKSFIWAVLPPSSTAESTLGAEVTGPAPLQLLAEPNYGLGERDDDSREDITKVEVNFGDGGGWSDVTADAQAMWSGEPVDWLNSTLEHTYTEPGDHIIIARLTFWDGEVVYSNIDEHTGQPEDSAFSNWVHVQVETPTQFE